MPVPPYNKESSEINILHSSENDNSLYMYICSLVDVAFIATLAHNSWSSCIVDHTSGRVTIRVDARTDDLGWGNLAAYLYRILARRLTRCVADHLVGLLGSSLRRLHNIKSESDTQLIAYLAV